MAGKYVESKVKTRLREQLGALGFRVSSFAYKPVGRNFCGDVTRPGGWRIQTECGQEITGNSADEVLKAAREMSGEA